MRFVVTGIGGFIGSSLGERLLELGHDVVGIDSMTPYYDVGLKQENAAAFDVVSADLAEAQIDDLLSDADGLFHLAGQPGVRSFGDTFPEYVRNNLLASQKVFEAAARLGVRVIFASSSSVYGDAERYPTSEGVVPQPVSPYGITKLGCEHLARAYERDFGLDVVVLRYFTVYGPRQRPDMAFARIAEAIRAGLPFEIYGDGTQSRSFTYVADAVEATLAAMTRAPAGRLYNVGGGAEASLLDAIRRFEAIAGRRLDAVFTASASGDVSRTAADLGRIRHELSWEPRVELDEGIRAQWEWAVGRAGSTSTVSTVDSFSQTA